MIAQELSVYSGYIDPAIFKLYAFAGISTYVLCTGTLGFVALTTYNDDHDRVVWRPGVPLLDRYIRADERAALDRIACAWGFKELWKRGDEDGEEWEGLRQLLSIASVHDYVEMVWMTRMPMNASTTTIRTTIVENLLMASLISEHRKRSAYCEALGATAQDMTVNRTRLIQAAAKLKATNPFDKSNKEMFGTSMSIGYRAVQDWLTRLRDECENLVQARRELEQLLGPGSAIISGLSTRLSLDSVDPNRTRRGNPHNSVDSTGRSRWRSVTVFKYNQKVGHQREPVLFDPAHAVYKSAAARRTVIIASLNHLQSCRDTPQDAAMRDELCEDPRRRGSYDQAMPLHKARTRSPVVDSIADFQGYLAFLEQPHWSEQEDRNLSCGSDSRKARYKRFIATQYDAQLAASPEVELDWDSDYLAIQVS
ncbi:hypothetical protein OPT61_g9148 [Boeremia exigua]|uniref:Uncharacterized protein n=1 Tax=Boeremia exigua TaxID=749465 RepID=A0ACC2HWC5_9PLEO|nr:hypothetical protein OPT61_g9148 [Boeremia exigua]